MLRRTLLWAHGLLEFPCGTGKVVIGRGTALMVPANEHYHDPPKLRSILDAQGYLYFKDVLPRESLTTSLLEIYRSLEGVGLLLPGSLEYNSDFDPTNLQGRALDVSRAVLDASCGTKVMAAVRQIFGGSVLPMDHRALEVSIPRETHSFHMDSVFLGKGTRLLLSAWVPLTDTPLTRGPICFVKASNRHMDTERLRNTYGAYDAYSGDIEGSGMYSTDPAEMAQLSEGLVTSPVRCGDLVVFTAYTMHSFLTNTSRGVRISAESKWYLDGDDLGPDPRYRGHEPGPTKVGAESLASARARWK